MPIPVIDLFAGPGGLGEGFSSLNEGTNFALKLSVEKDAAAHSTLWLRALFRRLDDRSTYATYRRAPHDRRSSALNLLVASNRAAAAAASDEAWHAELGPRMHEEIRERITKRLGSADTWVLIGGPPCQAYSLVGRSRMRRIRGEEFEADERHTLYQEYLKIIADHHPAVFVLENVKGLLSSRLDGAQIFDQILRDLERPSAAVKSAQGPIEYQIHPVVASAAKGISRFIIRSEDHGIPQARHRIILVGVRTGISTPVVGLTPSRARISSADVIGDLPALRSGVSTETDGPEVWLRTVKQGASVIRHELQRDVSVSFERLIEAVSQAESGARDRASRGDNFLEWSPVVDPSHSLARWYADADLDGITGHQTRRHMPSDLWRYLFAAAFASVEGRSPILTDFPKALMPAHKNIESNPSPIFSDRFRVQVRDRPSTTITSHLSKDGHGFIHYDASQVRSLTVREAARLQTFPDSYEFEGSQTAQFQQIGNAVPPLLAEQIAAVVRDVLR